VTQLCGSKIIFVAGFYDAVLEKLEDIMHSGARAAIEAFKAKAPL
jgi:hypothetical protein